MIFNPVEHRLNPVAPADADETTLGGYADIHGRAAAFEGSDGEPYTAAIETEPAEPESGWVGYLIFLRWAHTGTAIMGHLETGDLVRGASEAEVSDALRCLPLTRVKQILDETIRRKRTEAADD